LTMNFSWSFSFHVEKSNNRTHFTLGGIWNWHVHFKLAQHTNTLWKWLQLPQRSEREYARHDSVATFVAVIFLPLPPVLYLYFLDNPRQWTWHSTNARALENVWNKITEQLARTGSEHPLIGPELDVASQEQLLNGLSGTGWPLTI
jgi:hypothetical protein